MGNGGGDEPGVGGGAADGGGAAPPPGIGKLKRRRLKVASARDSLGHGKDSSDRERKKDIERGV